MSSSAADAPGRVAPDDERAAPSGEAGDGQAAHPEGGGDDAVSSRTRPRRQGHRRLVTSVTAVAVAAAVVAGVIVAFTGNSAPAPARPATAGGTAAAAAAARPAALADEAAATVAVVRTGGSITGGPVSSKDGQLWLVENSQATGRPMLTVVNPATFAVSTHPLPSSLDGVSLRYTGAEAFDNVGQLWLGAQTVPSGQATTGVLVRYLPGTGAFAQFSLAGTCSGDPGEPPAQLFTASDGGVWVECAASADSGATAIVRLSRDGTFTQPVIVSYLNGTLPDTRLRNQIADLPQAKIGPLVPAAAGAMWGMTADGFVQVTAAGTETFIPADQAAIEMATQAIVLAQASQLVGNSAAGSVEGLGECRALSAPAGQARECVVSVDSADPTVSASPVGSAGPTVSASPVGSAGPTSSAAPVGSADVVTPAGDETVVGALPGDDGRVGAAIVHPAAMDASGDVWFIIDGTAGGRAPGGQYFFEVTSGGGTRIVPFSVPHDALPLPVGQAPVISQNGAVWTADPEWGPGALVAVMPKN